MMKEDGPDAVDLIDWLTQHTPAGQTVGIDGMTFSVAWCQRLEQELSDNGGEARHRLPDVRFHISRPPGAPINPLFVHDEKIVGLTVGQKIEGSERRGSRKKLANAILISALDDIAWITNLRTANDIAFSPMYVSFLYLDEKDGCSS